MGDEGLLAGEYEAHRTPRLAREQGRDELDVERFGAAAEAAADVGLDDADARGVHLQRAREHEVNVVRHLGRGVDGHALPHRIVLGQGRMHLHLVLAHLGAEIALLAHELGLGEAGRGTAELEKHVALDVVRAMGMDVDRSLGQGRLGAVVGGELAHAQADEAERLLGHRLVDRGYGGDRLAAIAHALAREGILALRYRQHAEGLVAIGPGDDGDDPREPGGCVDVELEDLRVAVRAAEDAPRKRPRRRDVGRVFGAARDLVGPVDHRHIAADRVRGCDLVHAASPRARSVAACWIASMIFT